jgi:hypothetical protein
MIEDVIDPKVERLNATHTLPDYRGVVSQNLRRYSGG